MDFKQAQVIIDKLRSQINLWNHEYYELNQPSVSDDFFDQKMEELITLETQWPELLTPDSPSQKVGSLTS